MEESLPSKTALNDPVNDSSEGPSQGSSSSTLEGLIIKLEQSVNTLLTVNLLALLDFSWF